MKSWIFPQLRFIRSTFRIAFNLRLRKNWACDLITPIGKTAIKSAFLRLATLAGTFIVVIELANYVLTGETFPIPTILIEIGAQISFLAVSLILAAAAWLTLRKLNKNISFSGLFVCAVYVHISYALWAVLVLVSLALAVVVIDLDMSSYKEALQYGKDILKIDNLLLYIWLIRKKGLAPAHERNLFLRIAGYWIVVFLTAVGLILGGAFVLQLGYNIVAS